MMKNIIGALRIDYRRSLSFLFAFGIMLFVVVSYASISDEISFNRGDVLYYMELFIMQGPFTMIILFIGVIPYGLSFCIDWENRFIRTNIIRVSCRSYAWAKVIVVATSSAAVILLGHLLTTCLLSLHMPLLGDEYYRAGYEVYTQTVFGSIIDVNALLYLLIRSVVSALHCSFWAVFALCISAFTADPFITLASPVIGSYFIINLTYALNFPAHLKLNSIAACNFDIGGIGISFLYAILFFLVLIILLGCLFYTQVKRRVENG